MALDLTKLEKVANLANGLKRAQCPACAEAGQDKKGEHLRIYPDGRFGCCVHPKDREHRKRIFALVGERGRQEIKVRVMPPKAGGPIQSGILGRLGQTFGSPKADVRAQTAGAVNVTARDAGDGVNEVQPPSSTSQSSGTLGTGVANSKPDTSSGGWLPWAGNGSLGTPGTGFQYSRVYVEKRPLEEPVNVYTYKEFREGVPGVPEQAGAMKAGRMPYLTPDGTLGIPFDSPERFHWWKPDGQGLKETIAELRSRMEAERKESHGTRI